MSADDRWAAVEATEAMNAMPDATRPDTDPHLRWSVPTTGSADDSTRADLLLVAMRTSLRKYEDPAVAGADGFVELPGHGGPHAMHHLSNWSWARSEVRRFDPARPASLLYRETGDGTLVLVGAMYTAPASSTPTDLDRRLPTAFARWHQHVNWCAPPRGQEDRESALTDSAPRFGPRGSITTRVACEAAGGAFVPRVFGWMAHVRIAGSDDLAFVWAGRAAPSDSTAVARDTALAAADTTHIATLASLRPPAPTAPAPALAASPLASPVTPVRAPRRTAPAPAPAPSAPSAAAVALAALRAKLLPREPTAAPADDGPVSGEFSSGLSTISYERYSPTSRGRHPGVLLLHDAGGPGPQAAALRQLAGSLTAHGYVVEVVHYLDRTGGTSPGLQERPRQFRQWVAAVHDGVDDLGRAGGVDPDRLGIFGAGLGGTLALMAAAEDGRVRAVAEYAGSIPARAAPLVRRLPPVLIAQGDHDRTLPTVEAYRIRALCQAVQAPFELDVVAGQDHAFRGLAADDVARKTVAFFDRYLTSPR